ncbi:uncharacterized protein BXZ73DRAFT_80047 [Epithele typhae]|uniref:uncharacterized protein n=1 Tax=Epithele typhae TaxID=378194 RepID=UPI002008E478|nr:uncharacterized protein BXZ73DRAFT_80047 [Epithele typhae]KAH9920844.1 hypothetical protein BXZ73DRAFT_80047 [Epithele typhae]
MSATTTATYHLRPVTATRSASPSTSTSTASDRSPPPLGAHRPPSKSMLPPSTHAFSPIPTSAHPRRPLSPSSLRGLRRPRKFPAPPTGHDLMAMFPPKPPMFPHFPTSNYFDKEERAFFNKAGPEIIRFRLDAAPAALPGAVGGGFPSPLPGPGVAAASPHVHSRERSRASSQVRGHHDRATLPPPPSAVAPLAPSPRSMGPPNGGFPPVPSPTGMHAGPGIPGPGYPTQRPPEHERAPVGGGAESMVVDDEDDEAWKRPIPHHARRRAGKHTRRVIANK